MQTGGAYVRLGHCKHALTGDNISPCERPGTWKVCDPNTAGRYPGDLLGCISVKTIIREPMGSVNSDNKERQLRKSTMHKEAVAMGDNFLWTSIPT